MLEKQFHEEVLKYKKFFEITVSKCKKTDYTASNYSKIIKLQSKANSKLLQYSYKDNYKLHFKEVQKTFELLDELLK